MVWVCGMMCRISGGKKCEKIVRPGMCMFVYDVYIKEMGEKKFFVAFLLPNQTRRCGGIQTHIRMYMYTDIRNREILHYKKK